MDAKEFKPSRPLETLTLSWQYQDDYLVFQIISATSESCLPTAWLVTGNSGNIEALRHVSDAQDFTDDQGDRKNSLTVIFIIQ